LKIVWFDSIQDISGWVDEGSYDFEAHEESMRMESVGWCVKVSDNVIFLAQSTGNDNISSIIAIPSGCIKSITVLRRD
jgi:hypothetical protein